MATGGTGENSDRKDGILFIQLVVISAQLVFATGFLAAARALVPIAGNAAWISCFIGLALGMGVAFMLGALARRFPNMDLVQMAEEAFSAPIGKIVGLTFVAYCTAILAIASKQFVLAISVPFLQSTPTGIVSGLFFALVTYAAYLGIEPIARVSVVFFAISLVSIVVMIILAIPMSVLTRLLPLLGKGPIPILAAGLEAGSYAAEIIVVLAFLKFSKDSHRRGITRAIGTGVAMGMAGLVVTVMFGVTMLGTAGVARVAFPAVETARIVGVGEFLERAEIVFLALWFSIAVLKLASVFYAAVASTARVMGLDDFRPVVMPFGVLAIALSLLPESVVESLATLKYFTKYSVWYAIALPTALLVATWARRSGGGGKQVSPEGGADNATAQTDGRG